MRKFTPLIAALALIWSTCFGSAAQAPDADVRSKPEPYVDLNGCYGPEWHAEAFRSTMAALTRIGYRIQPTVLPNGVRALQITHPRHPQNYMLLAMNLTGPVCPENAE